MPLPNNAIMMTGDMIQIIMPPPCVVPSVVAPVPLIGSSTATKVNMMAACLEGDELPKMLIPPQTYTSPPFITPGMGTFEIILKPENKSSKGKESKPYLLKGTVFDCKFSVVSPAQMPTPGGPVPDTLMTKMGKCQFITKNTTTECS
jgi:hypothetical protein